MSVFEVLRYSEIDLTDKNTLLALPPEIVLKYWLVVHEGVEKEIPLPPVNDKMCINLSRWANTAESVNEKKYVRDKFIRALREVDSI